MSSNEKIFYELIIMKNVKFENVENVKSLMKK